MVVDGEDGGQRHCVGHSSSCQSLPRLSRGKSVPGGGIGSRSPTDPFLVILKRRSSRKSRNVATSRIPLHFWIRHPFQVVAMTGPFDSSAESGRINIAVFSGVLHRRARHHPQVSIHTSDRLLFGP